LRKTQTSSQGGGEASVIGGPAGKPGEYQSAKHKNFIFQQMMKIDKMDRDAEKRQKERLLEVKNKDIEGIIQKTKREIKEQERREGEALVSSEVRMEVSQDEEVDEMSPPSTSPAIMPNKLKEAAEKPQLVQDTTRNPISAVGSMSSAG
jgi:hypothetical protein